MTEALNSNGFLVARAPAATPYTFTDIAQLGDLDLPELGGNEFDTSNQNSTIDHYIQGIMRRTPLAFPLNFLPTNATHDHLTGLYKARIDGTYDGYKMYHSASGLIWIASGQVKSIKPKAPVDGKLSAEVNIRFSGPMIMNGVTIGT